MSAPASQYLAARGDHDRASDARRGEAAPEEIADVALDAVAVNAWYGKKLAIRDVSIAFGRNSITALMGPSGCGKTTFLRCLNRIHESAIGARSAGQVMLDGRDIYAPGTNPIVTRRRVGMVFQRPNPFPTMSILDNVTAGPRRTGLLKGARSLRESAEEATRESSVVRGGKGQARRAGVRAFRRAAATLVYRPGFGGETRGAVDG